MNNQNSSPNYITVLKTHSRRLTAITRLLVFLLTCALYALLMLRDDVPIVALAVLCLLWLLLLFLEGQESYLTPLQVPIIGLLILLPLNLLISADTQATLPKIYGLLLSFSLFFMIIRLVQFRKHLPLLIFSLIALSLGAALLGLFATDWPEGGLAFISLIAQKLPRISSLLTGASINKNTMGGALTFFPPLLLSLFWDENSFKSLLAKFPQFKKFPDWFYKVFLLFIFGLILLVLLLTQSRGAWLGTALGLFVFLVWKDNRFLILIPIGLILLYLLVLQTGDGTLPGFFSLLDQGQDASLTGRLQIWARIISLIRDFPITGVGLDAISSVYPIYFNPFLFSESTAALFHAHNTLLSVTIEMGIPALILYVALLSSFFIMAKHAWKHARTINRVLIMGLVCGMISHQFFGIMDAFTLGKTLGVTIWMYYAILAALFIHRDQMIHSKLPQDNPEINLSRKAQTRYLLLGLASWMVLSLIVLAFCQINIFVCLLLSLFAGILLGWLLTNRFISLSAMSDQLPPIANELN